MEDRNVMAGSAAHANDLRSEILNSETAFLQSIFYNFEILGVVIACDVTMDKVGGCH